MGKRVKRERMRIKGEKVKEGDIEGKRKGAKKCRKDIWREKQKREGCRGDDAMEENEVKGRRRSVGRKIYKERQKNRVGRERNILIGEKERKRSRRRRLRGKR